MNEELESKIQFSLLRFHSLKLPAGIASLKPRNIGLTIPSDRTCVYYPFSSSPQAQLLPEMFLGLGFPSGWELVVLVQQDYKDENETVRVWHGMASDGTILYALGNAS